MKIVKVRSVRERVKIAKRLILSPGNRIGVVHFRKRSDGSKRKMSYRIHVFKPQYAKTPTGKGSKKQKKINQEKDLVTVFDTNCINYNRKGMMNGRGGFRSVPLDSITRIAVGGEIYKIMAD